MTTEILAVVNAIVYGLFYWLGRSHQRQHHREKTFTALSKHLNSLNSTQADLDRARDLYHNTALELIRTRQDLNKVAHRLASARRKLARQHAALKPQPPTER